jgi:hypothetical protein
VETASKATISFFMVGSSCELIGMENFSQEGRG